MIRQFLALCVAATVIAPAHAGWRGAEWGMTPGQVGEARQGEAELTKAGKSGASSKGRLPGNRGTLTRDGEKYEVKYYYDDRGLRRVMLEPKRQSRKRCAKLAEIAMAEHGQPIRSSDQMIIKLVIWHDESAQNRVRLLLAGGGDACGLHYERLADFEEIDLQNPGHEIKQPKRSGSVPIGPLEVTITD